MRDSDYCINHSPDHAEARRRRAAKGGKRGGRGRGGASEVAQVRGEIRAVIGGVLNGSIHRSTGSVMFMGFNVLLRSYETELKIRELDEIIPRIEALEERRDGAGYRGWQNR